MLNNQFVMINHTYFTNYHKFIITFNSIFNRSQLFSTFSSHYISTFTPIIIFIVIKRL